MTKTHIRALLLKLSIVLGLLITVSHPGLEVVASPIEDSLNHAYLGNENDSVDVDYGIYEKDVIEIKFRDSYTMRLRGDRPVDLGGRSTLSPKAEAAFEAITSGEWRRLHAVGEVELDRLRRQAERNSRQAMPDLNNYYRLRLPEGMEAAEAIALFASLDEVEVALAVPKPAPPPTPPDYQDPGTAGTFYQMYLDAAVDGIDARYAWGGGGGTGSGIKICDIEYDWNRDHADLPFVSLVSLPPIGGIPDDWRQHGTAVLGILGSLDNGWGTTGIAHDAALRFAAVNTVNGFSIASAVSACASSLDPGDVIIIEQQIAGPNRPSNPADGDQTGLVPVEWNKANYDAITLAVAAGVVVIEAAGNGGENLDSSDYTTGNAGHHPFLSGNDSGAIIVGAGMPPNGSGLTQRTRLAFSNYGSTVDLQGWGALIIAPGYGDYYDDEGDDLYYTSFGGTSGASPMVAAAAAIVQANYRLKTGSPALPSQVKVLLRDTGTPQEGSDNIGPLPDLAGAINELWGFDPPDAPILSPASGSYDMPMEVTIDYAPGQSGDNTAIRYTLNGSEPGEDSYIFVPEFDDAIFLNYGATVKAKAFQYVSAADRRFESPTAEAVYISTTPKVATPEISPGGGVYNQGQTFVITTNTPGATIRYRTDGRSPSFFYPGTEYTGPFTLDPGTYEITARGYKDGYYKSDAALSGEIVVNAIQLPSPTIYPNGGNYAGSATVYMGSTVLGADIHYTLDGSTPTESSLPFINPFELTQDTTVKARVFLAGYTPSEITEAIFDITQQASTPSVSPPSGTTATTSLQVTLSTSTPGATIRYTTNGAEPTSYSTAYTAPFDLGIGQHTVKAKAFLAGADPSGTAEASYTVYDPDAVKVVAPVIDPGGGNHTEVVTVTITTATEGAAIRYTLDGTIPTETSTLYTSPLVFTASPDTYILRAVAFKAGMTPSDFTPATFGVFEAQGTIDPPPTISPPSGTYTNMVQVTIDLFRTPPFYVPTIYLTKDGTDPVVPPNTAGKLPPFSFSQSEPATIKAIGAQLARHNSEIVSAEYTFVCDTPNISPASGTFTGSVIVTMTTGTSNGGIYYTTDGGEPTESDLEYAEPFTLTAGTYTLKAKCFRNNFDPSETAVGVLVIGATPAAPTIITQPASRTVEAGEAVTFTVEVKGTPDPTYQWFRDSVPLAGEIEPQLVVPAAQDRDAGDYQLVARNDVGTVTSTIAALRVIDPPEITMTQPEDGASNVVLNQPIDVFFSEAMSTTSVSTIITPTLTVTPSWSAADMRLTLAHDGLAASTRYTVSITGGTDLTGESLVIAPYTWVFTTSTTVAPVADLALSKGRIGGGDVTAGELVTYTFTITNNGPTSPVTATVVDTFSSAGALANVTGSGCAWSPGSVDVTCTITDVFTDSLTALTLTVTIDEAYSGTLTNDATVVVAGDVVDLEPANDGGGLAITVVQEAPQGDSHPVYLPIVIRE